MEKFTRHTGVGVPLRRSNVDTDQIIPGVLPQAGDPDRVRGRAVRCLAQRPRLRPQPAGVRRRLGPGRRPRLRHRLVARARRVGLAELRIPGRAVAAVRRHLPRQLRQGRTARRAGRREGRAAAVGPARARAGHRGDGRPRARTVRAGEGPDRIEDSFDIDDYTRWRLLEGLDDIGITLSHEADIAAYEADPAGVEARPPCSDDSAAATGVTPSRETPSDFVKAEFAAW